MEKYQPMQMPMSMPMPNAMPMPMPTAVSPASMPAPVYGAPINVHASYEEINIYAPKKHKSHCVPNVWGSTAIILVLYILLVIILRSAYR